MAVAAQAQWDGISQVWALLALALLWPALDHQLGRTDGRWYGLSRSPRPAAAVRGGGSGSARADAARSSGPGPSHSGASIAAALGVRGRALGEVEEGEEHSRLVRSGLWLVRRAACPVRRDRRAPALFRATESLAETGGASLRAGGERLVADLRRRRSCCSASAAALKPVRVAGLAVAGLAVVKVIFFDLSSLDALYRVGSVFLLGLVMLSLAYLYYRSRPSERPP